MKYSFPCLILKIMSVPLQSMSFLLHLNTFIFNEKRNRTAEVLVIDSRAARKRECSRGESQNQTFTEMSREKRLPNLHAIRKTFLAKSLALS